MSGGSLNYAYRDVEAIALVLDNKENTPLVRAFGKHLHKVAVALHDIEWVKSMDLSPGDEVPAIVDVIGDRDAAEVDLLKDDAKQLIQSLETVLEKLESHLSSKE